MEDATSRDRQILDTNKKFVENASIVSEAVAFDTEAIKFHDFLSQLGDVVQKASLLTDISISHGKGVDSVAESPSLGINLTGKVFEESQATPAQVLETFQKAILGMECLQGKNPTIEIISVSIWKVDFVCSSKNEYSIGCEGSIDAHVFSISFTIVFRSPAAFTFM